MIQMTINAAEPQSTLYSWFDFSLADKDSLEFKVIGADIPCVITKQMLDAVNEIHIYPHQNKVVFYLKHSA